MLYLLMSVENTKKYLNLYFNSLNNFLPFKFQTYTHQQYSMELFVWNIEIPQLFKTSQSTKISTITQHPQGSNQRPPGEEATQYKAIVS